MVEVPRERQKRQKYYVKLDVYGEGRYKYRYRVSDYFGPHVKALPKQLHIDLEVS